MAEKRHHVELKTRFGPADLFRVLKTACAKTDLRAFKPDFDFDWMERSIEVSAESLEAAKKLLEAVENAVNKRAGAGQLLPGKPEYCRDDRVAIPIGILIQTPDIYVEMFIQTLTELGITGILLECEGSGFSLPVGKIARTIGYESVIRDFPLPPYLVLLDRGIVEKKLE